MRFIGAFGLEYRSVCYDIIDVPYRGNPGTCVKSDNRTIYVHVSHITIVCAYGTRKLKKKNERFVGQRTERRAVIIIVLKRVRNRPWFTIIIIVYDIYVTRQKRYY